jgi:predicted cupin superfamily sugar epimerase
MSEADRVIAMLKLKPHPEGGHYRETFRDKKAANKRAHSTAIYFLLRRGEVSRAHRIDAAEVWHWHAGAPLELTIVDAKGKRNRLLLGNVLAKKQTPQIVVPAFVWQSARTLGAYTLVGCTVAPGFEFAKFELAAKRFNASAARPARPAANARSRAKRRGPKSPATG